MVARVETLRQVPPIVWGMLVPALIIGAVQLRRPDGRRVHVVGAGYVADLAEQDEQEDAFFYELETVAHESVDDTVARTRALLPEWPRVVVVAFDAAAVAGGDGTEARVKMRALVEKLESVQAVPVVLPPRALPGDPPAVHALAEALDPWFYANLCQLGELRHCVKLDPGPTAPADWKAALQRTVATAVRFQSQLPSAQIGH